MATNKRLIKSNDEGGGASFNTVTYTGNDLNTGIQVTGVGFQPDLVWIKARTSAQNHDITDSVRGTHKWLASNLTQAETNEPLYGVDSFDADGFTISNSGGRTNAGFDYVAWCWKAGGAAVTNTDGTITSQVSANTEAGFSIVSYTGNGSVGSVGHGLGQIPNIIIAKNRDGTNSWVVRSSELGNGYLQLESTVAYSTTTLWGTPDDSVFSFTANANGLINNNKYIAYCFAEVAGFSKFGSYVGAGYPSTVSVDTGFEPAFVMIKASNLDRNWVMLDNKRGYGNNLSADTALAEYLTVNGQGQEVEFLENGFKVNANSSWTNNSGTSYIYMAFANQF